MLFASLHQPGCKALGSILQTHVSQGRYLLCVIIVSLSKYGSAFSTHQLFNWATHQSSPKERVITFYHLADRWGFNYFSI